MHKMRFSWCEGVGVRCQGGNQDNPDWFEIDFRLERARVHSGVVDLTLVDANEIGPQCLQVICDRPGFVLMLGECDGAEYRVRSFTNANAAFGQVEIMGNYWDARLVCADFAIVKSVLREFFDTGNVSREVLN